ncbi:MAG: aminoacyl-tRNA hydrolase [Candidatus Omnitrophota bacterium]
MKLIVGLGNPGRLYIGSRHNIGFSVIKALAKGCKIPLTKEKGSSALSGKIKIGTQNVILAMPLTFMNLSGTPVSSLLNKHRINLDDLLIVCDDLDLEFGRIKLRPSGSSGGHRGLESIIGSLGSQGFARLRIGVDRPPKHTEASEYVLSPFTRREKEQIGQIIEDAQEACRSWAVEGVTETMNIFNKRRNDNG